MAAHAEASFPCPLCKRVISTDISGDVECPVCPWQGNIEFYDPLPRTSTGSQEALPDSATCIHHPTKMAEVVCEGTGDYICSLCAVELNGHTYSAQYLEQGGKEIAAKAFDRYLERPDRKAQLTIGLTIFFWPLAIVTIPLAIYYYIKMFGVRKTDPLYRHVIPTSRMVIVGTGIVLFGVLCILIFGSVIFASLMSGI